MQYIFILVLAFWHVYLNFGQCIEYFNGDIGQVKVLYHPPYSLHTALPINVHLILKVFLSPGCLDHTARPLACTRIGIALSLHWTLCVNFMSLYSFPHTVHFSVAVIH